MVGSAGLRFGVLLAAAAACAVVALPAARSAPAAHGEQLVASYRLPPEAIARYAARASGTGADESARLTSMLADRSPWVGPEHRAGVGRNPYTMVLTVSGVARAAGDVHAQWQAGWELIESPVASRELLMSLSGLARKGVAAGQALTMTTRSTPVSFRGDRQVAPMLGLVQTRNLDIRDVQVEVWSGSVPLPWPALPWAPLASVGAATIGALALLALWQRVRLRQRRPAADAGADDEDEDSERGLSSEAPPPPFRPTASHDLRVFESLHDVLHHGLVVASVPDETRPPRRVRTPRPDAPTG